MELIIFNEENSKQVSTGVATIRVGRKSGLLAFSKGASEKLGLAPDKRVLIANDAKSPEDWYICVTSDDSGFRLRLKGSEAAAFNCSFIANKILDSVKIAKSAGFKIAPDPIDVGGAEYFAIITANPLNPR